MVLIAIVKHSVRTDKSEIYLSRTNGAGCLGLEDDFGTSPLEPSREPVFLWETFWLPRASLGHDVDLKYNKILLKALTA